MNSKGKKKEHYQILDKNIKGMGDDEDSDEYETYESEMTDEEIMNYYEGSSDSENEIECDVWDVDCKVLPFNETYSTLIGCHLMPTCSRDPDLQPNKKQKVSPELNPALLSNSLADTFKENWAKSTALINDNLELVVEPFKVCVINNFLANEKILDKIREEFYELDWNLRSMDLYEFFQSKDLTYLSSEYIRSMFEFLKTDIMTWVANLTGLNLTHISATCSFYSNTDYLLVHDDQRDDRLVAFILYLNKNWNEHKGGTLQLLSKDTDGNPLEAVRNICPNNNQFVFFSVTNDSYHQVTEVTCINDCRLSINGWFHTKIPPIFKTPPFTPLANGLYSTNVVKAKEVDIDLDSWINEDYLDTKAIKLIQKHVEENSEISLKSFLKRESFTEILQTLESEEINWIKVGPPNRYSYEIIDIKNVPHIIDRFLSLFQSTAIFQLLQKYTELELNTAKASMRFELQRWTPGSYSLLTDYNWQEKNELDLIMYFGCIKNPDVIGARTQYVTMEDEIQNALITLEPEQNNLNIVYRDSARYTKYFSKQSKCQCFYMIICSYSE